MVSRVNNFVSIFANINSVFFKIDIHCKQFLNDSYQLNKYLSKYFDMCNLNLMNCERLMENMEFSPERETTDEAIKIDEKM